MQTPSLRKRFNRYSVFLVLVVIFLQLLLFAGYEILHEYMEEEYWYSLVEDKSKLKAFEREHFLHEVKEIFILTVIGLVTAPLFIWFVRHFSSKTLKPLEEIAEATRRIGKGQLGVVLPDYEGDDEIGTLVRALKQAFEQYQASLEQARRFSADASHQLRTPLAVIRSAGEVSLAKARNPEEYQDTLHMILEESLRLEHIVEQLLRLANLKKDEVRTRFTPVQASAVLQHIDEQYGPVAEAKEIAWSVDCSTSWVLPGDEALLVEALANLVDNALHVTPPGGRVSVQADAECFRVQDGGPGVSLHDQEHIFDRFHRSAQASYEGSGLGLSIVQAIAELHDGRLHLASTGQPGACFTLRLNATQAAE